MARFRVPSRSMVLGAGQAANVSRRTATYDLQSQALHCRFGPTLRSGHLPTGFVSYGFRAGCATINPLTTSAFPGKPLTSSSLATFQPVKCASRFTCRALRCS